MRRAKEKEKYKKRKSIVDIGSFQHYGKTKIKVMDGYMNFLIIFHFLQR